MENFFNYITKPIKPEEFEIWFRSNDITNEKLELFLDFSNSLNSIIIETYLGEPNDSNETKITLSEEDNKKHFEWCWGKVIDNFEKENIKFSKSGEHQEYFKNFYDDIFYNQKDEKIRHSIGKFFTDLFDLNKTFTHSDLDMILSIYKSLDKNIKK